MSTDSSLAVIIVSYHTGPALWLCLDHAFRQKDVAEIILINNGNSRFVENRLQRIADQDHRLRVITGQGNIGFGRGCNLGVRMAQSQFVVLLNPDAILLRENALQTLSSLFDASAAPWLVGGWVINEDGSEQRANRRALMTPQTALGEGLKLYKIRPEKFPRLNLNGTEKPSVGTEVDGVSGACMMLQRDRYIALGGMDEGYFLHAEDVDLFARIHREGGAIQIHPEVPILHFRSTSAVSSLFIEYWKMRGFLRYFFKHSSQHVGWRLAAQSAAIGRFFLRSPFSLFKMLLPKLRLSTPAGIKRIYAIHHTYQAEKAAPVCGGLPLGCRVMVLGASTAIGLSVIGRLLASGRNVVAVSHKTIVPFEHPNLVWAYANMESPESFVEAVHSIACDYVISAAPIWHMPALLPTLRRLGALHLVAFSSTSVLTKNDSSDRAELAQVDKLKKGELATQRRCEETGMSYTILRPTMVYGAGIDVNITRIARWVDRFRIFPVELPALGKRAPIHADDLAQAAIIALGSDHARGNIYNLSGASVLSYRTLPERIAKVMGLSVRLLPIPALRFVCMLLHPLLPKIVPPPAMAARMQQHQVFPDERVARTLHIKPRAFLSAGMADLGELGEEEACKLLLPVQQDSCPEKKEVAA